MGQLAKKHGRRFCPQVGLGNSALEDEDMGWVQGCFGSLNLLTFTALKKKETVVHRAVHTKHCTGKKLNTFQTHFLLQITVMVRPATRGGLFCI